MAAVGVVNGFGCGQLDSERIAMDTVYAKLVVQVRSGGKPGFADVADGLFLLDPFPGV